MINNSALFEVELRQGLRQLGLILDEAQILQTLNFAHEFLRWNQVHNLSAIESEELFLSTHLLDSLSVVRPLKDAVISGLLPKEPLIADLGAGGGFPSILLAIALPTVQFVLLESTRKKAAFLMQVTGRLNLSNVTVEVQRVEDYSAKKPHSVDATISRAFTELTKFVAYSGPLLRPNGLVFAMKSQKVIEELKSLSNGWEVIDNTELKIPNLEAYRCLLTIAAVR